ncbi:hypothetical protein CHCC14820_1694 [Bacillus paralicheniformis]|uniref:DUF2127 domain-containing protein n=1 Tax=Bacillus paralicheniformis TaxID=1648923 RepID=A0AAW6KE52_9BACI|nr:hypothetical protein [Bacillus paralicheniformis]MDE1453890.1 hypothetical protein [Bacillus paralicheniformis]MED1068488.1 hypothetical protein [Bacillus paralicheniformis]PAC95635.1 hypothetical protein CHH86_18170 [Bacillus paralicheniformis]TWM39052.1 hypothetical protein CHCC14820_1694 [Bacillus paralicheniformis]
MSWYIRPVFLVALAYFCYRRTWNGVIVIFLLMTSSMFWFPVPERINPEMQAVLDYEQMLLSNPLSAVLTLAFMMGFLVLIGAAFWKRSLGWGLAVLNVTLIGKVVLSVMLTGENGWAPLGNTMFGLILVNGIGLLLIAWRRKRRQAGR